MLAVGVIEIAAGILVAVKPRLGAPIVAVWLCLIILNLLTMGAYLDVALRQMSAWLSERSLSRASHWNSTEREPGREEAIEAVSATRAGRRSGCVFPALTLYPVEDRPPDVAVHRTGLECPHGKRCDVCEISYCFPK